MQRRRGHAVPAVISHPAGRQAIRTYLHQYAIKLTSATLITIIDKA